MKRLQALAGLFPLFLLSSLHVSACTPDTGLGFEASQLTSDGGLGMCVSGDRVVWECGGDVSTWTPETGIVQITNDPAYDVFVEVEGDRVVWAGYVSGEIDESAEIFTWTPVDGVVRITYDNKWDFYPQVSGDRVVWNGGGGKIFTWTPAEGIVQLTNDDRRDRSPQVSGDRVVWETDVGNYQAGDIFTWTPAGGVVQLTTGGGGSNPQVSGDRVVWQGGGLCTWTPADGIVQLGSGENPQVSGDRVVWQDGDIFTWTPTTGIVQITANNRHNEYPQVSGDLVVWQLWDGDLDRNHGDYEIFAWTAGPDTKGTILRITANDVEDMDPQVCGNRVVWAGELSGDPVVFEVFTAVFSGPQANKPVQSDGEAAADRLER